ncbi:unnamed protein product [Vitrella brassicaformis CCMP3155]|uniref:TerD domain-containing protein n=2 Tax=Vitrella brassicaformis TaxID=1169539 RepID=A0A0G4FGY4_VITBC|nr:unnamed protein product [Vitrella brassicaformis CCMP3155]|eukprot:CEM12671.1 unnamed protein product [Vitrella brassicaformis CCMP3155]
MRPPAYDDETHKGSVLQKTADFPLQGVGRVAFCLSWDFGGSAVDADVQALAVDNRGRITDACYYNNLKALGKALTHSGDSLDGKEEGVDEKVAVNVSRLGQEIELIIILVCCYSGGSLGNLVEGILRVADDESKCTLAQFVLREKGQATANILCAMFRHGGSWSVRTIDHALADGQRHFMDCLESIQTHIRSFIPSAPTRQKLAFSMRKGGIFDFGSQQDLIVCGLGWDVSMGQVDLDASCCLLDQNNNFVEAVFFGNLKSKEHGVQHSGDNLTGEGEGDDEQVTVHLSQIGERIKCLYFCIHIYTPNKTFMQVANPYCRVCDGSTGEEWCRYQLREAGPSSGLIIARLQRDPSGRWGFGALGVPSNGRLYKDSVPDMQRLNSVATNTLLEHQQSMLGVPPPQVIAVTTTTGPAAAPAPYPVQTPAPPPPKQNKCCTIL